MRGSRPLARLGAWAEGVLVLVLAWAVALVAGGCGGGTESGDAVPPPAPAVRSASIEVDGVARTYRLFVPTTLDRTEPAPLVMVLHGGGNSVQSMVETTGFDQAASAGDFIAVYPEATGQAWNAGFCCGSAPERGVDDVGFLNQLLDQLVAEGSVDPGRVFVTGVSNGAMLAYRYACEEAERVQAIASVAGSVTVEDCRPSRPVSVLELRGSAVPLVPFEGGSPDLPEARTRAPYPSAPVVAAMWAEVAGCEGSTASTRGPVTTTEWDGCVEGTAVRLVRVEGGGHVWFAPGLGEANGAVDATSAVTSFFFGPTSRSQ